MNPPGAHRRIARWPFRVAGAALVMAIGAGTAMAQTVVTTTSGALEGAVGDGALRVFKGVPFAAPPVGARRWKAPAPPTSWRGKRTATAFGAQCMQPPVFAISNEEFPTPVAPPARLPQVSASMRVFKAAMSACTSASVSRSAVNACCSDRTKRL